MVYMHILEHAQKRNFIKMLATLSDNYASVTLEVF